MTFENLFSLKNAKESHSNTLSLTRTQRKSTQDLRPQTAASSKSKFTFDKPSLRCSGPYDTYDHIKTV